MGWDEKYDAINSEDRKLAIMIDLREHELIKC